MTAVEPALTTRLLAARARLRQAIADLDLETAQKEWDVLDRLLDQLTQQDGH